jgi:hypothetical protein
MAHAATGKGSAASPHGSTDPADTRAEQGSAWRCWHPDDPDRLIAELRARGVAYLSGGRTPGLDKAVAAAPLAGADLLHYLADSNEPRLRDATIALFLLHPELADAVSAVALETTDKTEGFARAVSEQSVVLALAATYLQRMWRTRLGLALGPVPWLPPRHWRERGLPAPWILHGEQGLCALAERERDRRGQAFNYLSAWQDQVDRLAAQAWAAHRHDGDSSMPMGSGAQTDVGGSRVPEAPQRFRGLPHAPRGSNAMSLRQPVDRSAIEQFLRQLGSEVRRPGRVYLVGGTTMVYEGYRARTLDIDLIVEADDPGPLIAAIRRLKDALGVNVEFASPGDFIPLPGGWRERSIWVGRFGDLDVFHFDLYSVALSKIERGTERDFADVLVLLQDGRLEWDRLDAAFGEVLPRIATEGLGSMDPQVFAAHYQALRDRLGA